MKPKRKSPAKKSSPEAPDFWWFESGTVDALRERLIAAGGGTRLEVRLDQAQNMKLRVVPQGFTSESAGTDDLNKSNICPPICP